MAQIVHDADHHATCGVGRAPASAPRVASMARRFPPPWRADKIAAWICLRDIEAEAMQVHRAMYPDGWRQAAGRAVGRPT
jgi:hypothetical protein